MNNEQSTNAVTPGPRVVEWLALLCLMASPLLGPVLLGGSRLWASGPLMALVFLGAMLVCVRFLIGRDANMPLNVPPAGLAWLGFLLYGAGAIWVCDTPYEARVELLRAASLWAAYWAWSNLVDRGQRWRWVLGLLLLAGTLNAWYGLIHYFQGLPDRVLWYDRSVEGAAYGPRVSGTYFCPNHWASFLAMLSALALALVFTPECGVFLRLLAAYALLTFLPAIHVSQSRAGWIGVAAGLLVTALALVWRRSRIWFAIMLVILPMALTGAAVLYWQHSPAFRGRFTEAFGELQNGGFRVNQWRDTLLMIKDRPWFGHGPGSYAWVAEAFRHHMKDATHQAMYAHDDYLQSLAEVGAVGTLLVVLPLAWLLLKLLRTLHGTRNLNNAGLLAGLLGAWAAMLVHALFDFNLRIYANVAVLALLTGVVSGRLFVRHDWATPTFITSFFRRVMTGLGAVIMALLLVVTAWTLVSYYSELQADNALRQLDYDRTEQRAKLAWHVDHGNWYAAETLGKMLQLRARWGQDEQQRKADTEGSVRWFEFAAQGNRCNMETRHNWGLSLINAGQTEAGLRLLRPAAEANPMNVVFCSQLGLQLRLLGRNSEALVEFRKAAAIEGNDMINANLRWLERQTKQDGSSSH